MTALFIRSSASLGISLRVTQAGGAAAASKVGADYEACGRCRREKRKEVK